MKKQLLKTMLLLFALIAGSSSVWAAEAGFTLASATQVPLAAGDTKTTTITGTASETWNVEITGTWSSSSLQGSAGDKIWQLGKKDGAISTATFSTSGITGTITKVVVRCSSYAGKAQVRCTVGGSDFGTQAQSTPSWTTIGNVTFSGSASGAIVVTLDNSDAAARAVYIQSITVTYTPDATVDVTGVTVDPTEWTMEVGETKALTATVAPNDATDKTVTWSSNKESVATVSDAGVVTAVAAGTATITVTTTDGSKTATCAITVTAPAPAAPVAVTFDFTDESWGFPTDYVKTEATYTKDGYTITLGASSNGHKKMVSSSVLKGLIFGKENATLSLPAFDFNVEKIKVYGISGASGKVTFNVFVGENTVSTEVTSAATDHDFVIAADKQTAGTVYTIKLTNDNNCQISKIEIFGYVNTPAVTAAGWASYVTPKAMRFAEGEAFAVTAAGSGSVTLTEVTDVPNNFPVLLKGAGAKTAMVLETSPATPSNLLAVSTGGEISGYVLANKNDVVGFYKWAGGSLTSGKVYLPASAVAGAPDFLGFEGETTGVNEVKGVNEVNDNSWYNLAGQRVANPTKGLYIVNGKKVIIK